MRSDSCFGGACDGIIEYMNDDHIKFFHPNWMNRTLWPSLPTIDCLPLTDLLLQHNIVHVDFFSLDVEGAEMEVLRSLDLNKIKVDIFAIENNKHEAEYVDHFSHFGFDLKENRWPNSWFLRNHSKTRHYTYTA